MLIAAVVGDANVLLSAAIGKAALRVITELGVEVYVCGFNAEEVVGCLPRLASKDKLPYDLVGLQWRLLPVQLHPEPDYTGHLKQARAGLADRDPDDAHPRALARALGLPLWTNDKALPGHGVECFTTARPLALLTG